MSQPVDDGNDVGELVVEALRMEVAEQRAAVRHLRAQLAEMTARADLAERALRHAATTGRARFTA